MPKAYEYAEYPRIVFHPEHGGSITAKHEGEVPIGWLARHPNDPAHDTAEGVILAIPAHAGQMPEDGADNGPKEDPRELEKRSTPTNRTEIIAALRHRGVQFNIRAPTTLLYTALVEYEDNEARVAAKAAR